jgi:hypothetical protein
MVVQPNAIFNRKREGQIVKVLTAKTGWGMLVQDQSRLFSLRSDPTTLFRLRTGSNERDQRGGRPFSLLMFAPAINTITSFLLTQCLV